MNVFYYFILYTILDFYLTMARLNVPTTTEITQREDLVSKLFLYFNYHLKNKIIKITSIIIIMKEF